MRHTGPMSVEATPHGTPHRAHQRTWNEIRESNPGHSLNYARRWEKFEAEGKDIFGEARLVDAMAGRAARILDAGCGQGRLGGYLSERGHVVTGVDIDEVLISVAKRKHPTAEWIVGDLANLPELVSETFDLIICAGNVVTFVDQRDRERVLANLAAALSEDGRAVIGFGAQRGWDFDEFLATAEQCGFRLDARFSTWDLHPFEEHSDFMVAVLSKI